LKILTLDIIRPILIGLKKIKTKGFRMRYYLLLYLFIFINSSLIATELKLSSSFPKNGDTIEITYKYDFRVDESVDLYAIFYNFEKDKFEPKAEEVLLNYNKNNKTAMGKYRINSDAVYTIVKIYQFDRSVEFEDNNNRKFWDLKVIKNNKPQRNTYYHNAITLMGNMSENYNRLPDLLEAKKLLNKEISFYPNNNAAKIALNTLKLDLREMNYDDFEKEVLEILKGKINFNSEIDLKTTVRALKAVNKNEEATALTDKYIKRFPKSEVAEEEFIFMISETKSFEEFEELAFEYFDMFAHSENKERIFSALISSYHQKHRATELVDKFKELENVPLEVKLDLALKIALDSTYFKDSADVFIYTFVYEIFKKDYFKLNQDVKDKKYLTLNEKLTPIENKKLNYSLLNTVYIVFARIAKRFNHKEAYFINYSESYYLLGDLAPLEAKYYYLVSFKDRLLPDEGIEEAEKIMLSGFMSDSVIGLYKYFLKEDGKGELIEAKVKEIKEKYNYFKKDNLYYQRLHSQILNGVLQETDETLLDLGTLKGKTTVLMFFSSWCGPCQTAVPMMEELQELYLNDEKVFIAGVNSWENSQERDMIINEFLDEYKPKYKILIDPTDSFPQKYGITGLPTLLIIDKNNQIQFIEKGFNNDINNLIDKIELLKNIKE